MKRIANLEEYKFTITRSGPDGVGVRQPIATSDGELLKTPLNTVVMNSREPITRATLRQIDKICDIIDTAQASQEKTLLLEDADYKFLRERHDKYGNWSPQDDIRKCILKMGEKLESAEEYDPAKKTGGEKSAEETKKEK